MQSQSQSTDTNASDDIFGPSSSSHGDFLADLDANELPAFGFAHQDEDGVHGIVEPEDDLPHDQEELEHEPALTASLTHPEKEHPETSARSGERRLSGTTELPGSEKPGVVVAGSAVVMEEEEEEDAEEHSPTKGETLEDSPSLTAQLTHPTSPKTKTAVHQAPIAVDAPSTVFTAKSASTGPSDESHFVRATSQDPPPSSRSLVSQSTSQDVETSVGGMEGRNEDQAEASEGLFAVHGEAGAESADFFEEIAKEDGKRSLVAQPAVEDSNVHPTSEPIEATSQVNPPTEAEEVEMFGGTDSALVDPFFASSAEDEHPPLDTTSGPLPALQSQHQPPPPTEENEQDLFGAPNEGDATLFGDVEQGSELDELVRASARPVDSHAPQEEEHAALVVVEEEGQTDELFAGAQAQGDDDLFGAADEEVGGDLFGGGDDEKTVDLFDGGDDQKTVSLFDGGDDKTTDDLFAGTTSNDAEWLGTSQPLGASEPLGESVDVAALSSDPWKDADLDAAGIPEGWLDESGGWNWYTEDERLEVARVMFPNGPEAGAKDEPVPAPLAPAPPPQPAMSSYMPQPAVPPPPVTSSYDPYVPPARPHIQASVSAYPTVPAAPYQSPPARAYQPLPTAAYQPATAPYVPAPTNPYASPHVTSGYGTTASISPYAPPATQPYAAPPALAAIAGNAFAPQPPKPASKPIERPKQTTAYDPPLLAKPSRSFLRATAATPAMATPMGMDASSASPMTPASPPRSTLPPPLAGPPKSSSAHGTVVPSSRAASFAQPTKGFDPPIPAFAAPPRTRSAASHAPATFPVAPPQDQQAFPVLPPGPPKGLPRSQTTVPAQGPSSKPAPSQPPPPPVSQFVPSPPSLRQRQQPLPYHSHDQQRPPQPPPPQGLISARNAPPSHSRGIDSELHEGMNELSAASAAKGTTPSYERTSSEPEADWPKRRSQPHNTTVEDVDDLFGADGERGGSTADSSFTHEAVAALEVEHDPEGGDYGMDDTRPFEDDDEEAPFRPQQASYQAQLDEPSAPHLAVTSPSKPRPALTASTFSPPSGNTNRAPLPRVAPESTNVYDPYAPQQPLNGPTKAPPALPSHTMTHGSKTNADVRPYGVSPPSQFVAPVQVGAASLGRSFVPSEASDPYAPAATPAGTYRAGGSAAPLPAFNASARQSSLDPYGLPQPIPVSDPYAARASLDEAGPTFSSSYEPPSNLDMPGIEEDPLERTVGIGRRMPSVAFGPSGRVVFVFQDSEADLPGAGVPHGYGGSDSRRRVDLRKFSDIVPSADVAATTTGFPGPLLFDPAVSKGSAAEKKKRERVLQYIDESVKEIEAGLPYLASTRGDALIRSEQEAKVVLLEIIRLMINNEGKIPTTDATGLQDVRDVLMRPTSSPASSTRSHASRHAESSSADRLSKATPAETSALSRMLLVGEQEKAVRYSMDAKLWSHALLISSSVGPELWKEVVQAFVSEGFTGPVSSASEQTLRIAYSMFGGSVASALDVVLPSSIPGSAPGDTAMEWRSVLCTVLANVKAGDVTTISLLGDRLAKAGLLSAAHVCYLLSQTSLWDASQELTPPKVVLYGASAGSAASDAIIYSELVEYALSLVPLSKGSPQFSGVPHLLPYKLRKAWDLFEGGNIALARSYSESIATAVRQAKVPSPSSAALVAKLQELSELMAPDGKSDSTLLKKVAKPNLDSIGSWFEGRLTKFIAGDEGSEGAEVAIGKSTSAPGGKSSDAVGPFSHYSAITGGGHTGQLGRAASSYDLGGANNNRLQPFHRTASAMAHRSPTALSAFQLRPLSAQSERSPSYTAETTYAPHPEQPEEQLASTSRRASSSHSGYGGQAESTMQPHVSLPSWGQSYDFDDTTVNQADKDEAADAGDFINPMMAFNPMGFTPPPQQGNQASYQLATQHDHLGHEEDDDDLGLGNASNRAKVTPKPAEEHNEDAKPSEPTKPTPPEPPKQTGSGRWLGRWWSKTPDGSSSGPIKAKLGDENAMVYDKELKRWVPKGSKGVPDVPKPPAPPPRAHTASPSTGPIAKPPASMSMTAPPSRSGTTAPPTGPPVGTGPSLRQSRPGPPGAPGSAPPQFNKSAAEVAAELMAGPPRKVGSAAGKKKPRYVAV